LRKGRCRALIPRLLPGLCLYPLWRPAQSQLIYNHSCYHRQIASNGQIDPYSDDVTFEQIYSPLFGWYRFLPLDKVLHNYNELVDIRESLLPEIYEVEVREGDPVAAVDWQPGWVPFAVSNAAYYGVDLEPLRGGSYGQVIEWGHDTSETRVLASSIAEFLQLAVQNLDRDEANRYDYYPLESGAGNSLSP